MCSTYAVQMRLYISVTDIPYILLSIYDRQGNFAKLHQELEECGYLFIPNFHPKDKIQIARKG